LSIGQDGAEDLTQIITSAERHKEVAAQAAAEATSSATKTREILTDMLVSIESEVANVRLESMQLQVGEFETVPLRILAVFGCKISFDEILEEMKLINDYLELGTNTAS